MGYHEVTEKKKKKKKKKKKSSSSPKSRIFVLKFSRSLYLGNHLSESIHTWWSIGTQ